MDDLSAFTEAEIEEAKELHMTGVIDANDSYEVIEPQAAVGFQRMDTRWVLAVRDGVLKARLVARDFAKKKRDDLFAAGSTRRTDRIVDVIATKYGYTSFEVDERAAYNCLPELEDVACVPPEEWLQARRDRGESDQVLWKMKRLLPGRRVAAKAWVSYVGVVLRSLDCEQDEAAPQFFRHKERQISVEVHMDDLHGCGPKASAEWMLEQLRVMLDLKKASTFKSGDTYSHLKRERHLFDDGRFIRISDAYVTRAADLLGLKDSKSVPTPAVDQNRRKPEDKEFPLQTDQIPLYRTCTSILLYEGHDTPEAQHAIRELTQDLREPSEMSMVRLKRVARYLYHHRDQGAWFPVDGKAEELAVRTDTDWAGDRVSRKSVTCVVYTVAGCTLSTSVTGQAIHAQSSGESEFYGNVTGVSGGLLLQHILAFLGMELPLTLYTDSAASRGVLNRLGVGKIRHLEVKTLWVQALVEKKRLRVKAIKGAVNSADIGTKTLQKERLEMLKTLLGVVHYFDSDVHPRVSEDNNGGYIDGKEMAQAIVRALAQCTVRRQC